MHEAPPFIAHRNGSIERPLVSYRNQSYPVYCITNLNGRRWPFGYASERQMPDGPNRPSHEVAATDFVVATVNLK